MTSSPWPMRVGDLLLRDPRPDDIDQLLAFRLIPEVNWFLLDTDVDPERFREELLAMPAGDNRFPCVAEADGCAVATGSLTIVDGMGQPGMPRRTEGQIGYMVDPRVAGRGYATSIARSLLAAAFGHLGLRRVTAGCFADNLASARVLEKVGMRREQHGIEDSWHDELGWVDGYTYAMLAREWADARPTPRHED